MSYNVAAVEVSASEAPLPMDDEPLLVLRDLQAFYGQSHVLHGVSATVRKGDVVALLGRNGAGKTTILRSIMGAHVRRSGGLRYGGHDLLKLPMYQIPRLGIGYVPEERGIFASLSVDENLTLPPTFNVGGLELTEIYRLFPNLKGRGRTPGTRLSGGEQQMLAIARVLRTGARLILLDEPTEGLAPIIVDQITAAVAELKHKGFTVLLVEQNFEVASTLADRFYVVEKGRIVDELHRSQLAARRESLYKNLGL
jgi:branched-chain amino acid transport system ATP-binding protein